MLESFSSRRRNSTSRKRFIKRLRILQLVSHLLSSRRFYARGFRLTSLTNENVRAFLLTDVLHTPRTFRSLSLVACYKVPRSSVSNYLADFQFGASSEGRLTYRCIVVIYNNLTKYFHRNNICIHRVTVRYKYQARFKWIQDSKMLEKPCYLRYVILLQVCGRLFGTKTAEKKRVALLRLPRKTGNLHLKTFQNTLSNFSGSI